MVFDSEKLERILGKPIYSRIDIILRAGVLSRKTARIIMDLDKWQMDDLYVELMQCGAILGVSSGTFRATKEALDYLASKEELENAE